MKRLMQGLGRALGAPLRAVRRRGPPAESVPEARRSAAPFYRDSAYRGATAPSSRLDSRRRGAARGAPRPAQSSARSDRFSRARYADEEDDAPPRRRFRLFRRHPRRRGRQPSRRDTGERRRLRLPVLRRRSSRAGGDSRDEQRRRETTRASRREVGSSAGRAEPRQQSLWHEPDEDYPYRRTSTATRAATRYDDEAAQASLRERIARRQAAQAGTGHSAAEKTSTVQAPPAKKRRRRVGGDPLRYRLYFTLHSHRLRHLSARVQRRRAGPEVWTAKPGLELVPKAIQWARKYRRHGSRFRDIETLRQDMLADDTSIKSLKDKPTVAEIVHHDGTRPRWGALLNGLVFHAHAQRVLEVGTDVGVASLYLARGLLDIFPMRTCALVTLDDNAETLRIARRNFHKIGFDDIIWIHEGPFAETLAEALPEVRPLDLVFMDGRHDYEATVQQFMRIRPATRTGTLIVITHIHRSPQMFRAWQAIQNTRRVAATVDLWHWGIVVIGDPPALHLHAGL